MTESLRLWMILATLTQAGEATKKAGEASRLAAKMLEAHNRERAAENLPPLALQPQLTAAAEAHARDMARHKKMVHEGSDGSQPADRIKRQGYAGQAVGENVAMGQKTVAQVMKAWMDSPPHRKNILGGFSEIGFGRAKDSAGHYYWCITFGRPWHRTAPEDAAGQLLDALNQARDAEHKPPLKRHPLLAAAAQRHARDIAAKKEFTRSDSDGVTPLDRVVKGGYKGKQLSLAVASGEPSAQSLVKTWKGNEAYTKILFGRFDEVGIGFAAADDGVPYWCAIFGESKAGRAK